MPGMNLSRFSKKHLAIYIIHLIWKQRLFNSFILSNSSFTAGLIMIKFVKNEKQYFQLNTGIESINIGVTGREINSTDYSGPGRDVRLSDKNLLSSVTGLDPGNIVMLEQVHGNDILVVDRFPEGNLPAYGEADGLITDLPGIALIIRTADCVPVFIYDSVKQVLGAVHSGWKGTMLNVAGECIGKMKIEFGSDPGDMHVFILPSIGPEMYEVNEDVAGHFPDNTLKAEGRLFVDLWGSIEESCVRSGVPEVQIFNTGICNRTNYNEFFSHRYGDAGRNLNFAFIRG